MNAGAKSVADGDEIPREPFFRVLAGVLLIMAAFAAIDYALVRQVEGDRQSSAQALFADGERLSNAGHYQEAVQSFRSALTNSPNNEHYQLGWILALQRLGKLDEAEEALTRVLEKDPTNGFANLTMARILLARNEESDAVWYYHRAIYGVWADNVLKQRVAVRFELADLLARSGNRSELLAEVLPLQGEAAQDAGTRARIARLLLAAGSSGRAADMYRELVRDNPQDAAAYAGLGNAAFSAGKYLEAQNAYSAAVRLNPADYEARQKLIASQEVLAMDPMARRIGRNERYQRSRSLLERTLTAWEACPGGDPEAANSARELLASKHPSPDIEAVDANIGLAEQLWKARGQACTQPEKAAEEPVALLMAKLAQ